MLRGSTKSKQLSLLFKEKHQLNLLFIFLPSQHRRAVDFKHCSSCESTKLLCFIIYIWPVSLIFKHITISARSHGIDYGAGQIGCSVTNGLPMLKRFLELYCPGAEPWRWAPPLVTRFGIIPRVQWRFDFFIKEMALANHNYWWSPLINHL